MSIRNRIEELLKDFNGTAGIIIRDRTGDEYISINEDTVFPAASIIKLYVLWVLHKYVKEGRADYSQRILLESSLKVGGFGMLKVMDNGLEPTIKDLAYLMICLSDNTATNILIDYLGIDNINEELAKEGFSQTILGRKMYDEEAKKKGIDNFVSPKDTLKVIELLTEEEITRNILKNQMCNNKLPLYFFRKVEFAHKTGDLPGIEHDAGTIYFGGRAVDVIVFTKDLTDNKEGVLLNNLVGEIIYKHYSDL